MLPRQLTLPLHPPAKLNPSPSHSCKLLCAPQKVNSRQISSLQPLFAKHPGWGYPSEDVRCTGAQKCPSVSPLFATLTHSVSRKSFACHSYANTRDGGVTPPPISASVLATPILFALCFHILTNCFSRNPFLFTTIRIAPGCGGLHVLCAPTSAASVLSLFLQAGGVGSKLLVIRVNPFAGKVLGKGRNFIGELCERIEPRTNLFGAAQRRRRLAARLAGKNFLDVSLDLDTPRLRLGSDFVGNLDLDFHSKTLARRTRKRRPFGEAKSSAVCGPKPQWPNCRLRGCRGMSKNCALRVSYPLRFWQNWVPYFPQRALRPPESQ